MEEVPLQKITPVRGKHWILQVQWHSAFNPRPIPLDSFLSPPQEHVGRDGCLSRGAATCSPSLLSPGVKLRRSAGHTEDTWWFWTAWRNWWGSVYASLVPCIVSVWNGLKVTCCCCFYFEDYISKIVEIQHSYWIGLVEREHEGHWSWVDGTDFNSTPTWVKYHAVQNDDITEKYLVCGV